MRLDANAEAEASFSEPVMCLKHNLLKCFFLYTMVQITEQNWRKFTT